MSHILLPFGDYMIRVRRVAVRLCVGIHGSAFMFLVKTLQAFPPIMQSVVALAEVVFTATHSIKELLTTEAGSIDKLHGTFTFRNLRCCIAAEAYARVNPFHFA